MMPSVISRGYAWVSLRVADLERSVAWYADVLDLGPMVTNSDTCAVDAIERFSYLIHTKSLLMVGLHHDPALDVASGGRDGLRLHHVAVSVDTDDLDKFREQLGEPGRQPGPVVSWSYGRWFEIRDPDANAVRLFAPNQPCAVGMTNSGFDGFVGRISGSVMARLNRDMERAAIADLNPSPNDSVLAIGFGPGIGIESSPRCSPLDRSPVSTRRPR